MGKRKQLIKYILQRFLYAFVTILVLIVITFLMMHALPGDPISGDKAVSPAVKAALQAKFGLDKPMFEQLIIYISNALRGDFGASIKYGRDVSVILGTAFPYSAELGLRAMILAVFGGVAIGSLSAVRRGSKIDTFGMGIAVLGVSVPNFIVAGLLQYFVALQFNKLTGTVVFPITGWEGEMAKVLPSIALCLSPLASISRLMRTSMLDVLSSDYIKTAKAKGLSEKMIIFRHALRNACMPVLTVLGPTIASILTGSFVVEQVFSIPGMGRYFVTSIKEQDYTMIAGTTIFFGIFLIVSILVVDILYGVVDPRVNVAGKKE
ncbi:MULTISPECIES: ABC transporter permease [Massilimicrobiota]|uniref:ABC transporter permease n=1 Tax=Massilimicrobiota timonensis TaxID=1776392 RepID=A0ABT7UK09_9FIRM|nr:MULTISPECIES: ABC transporter permease [Massilimicrobiota]MDM8196489.1 ABC transporter permease [Massilimicrobiota timonensis]OUN35394.1 peptide ABC transporter permease [Massilimicrobiota sp. An80]OUQ80273.1 peptide ABC transporter permease [Massilimicrobiota sp. An105]